MGFSWVIHVTLMGFSAVVNEEHAFFVPEENKNMIFCLVKK